MKRILFVDDEIRVLQGLRRMLHSLRTEWEMDFVEGGKEALEMMAEKDFDVVVTDMHMPLMDGAELLEKVLNVDPTVARIILSGQAERSAAVRAAGIAHQFLAKPCDADELKRTVSRTCALRERLSDRVLLEKVTAMGQIPSIPRIYQAVRDETNAEDPSICKVGAIIAQDMGMSAKILQLVNSAFFGLCRRVDSVAEATNLLGLDVIRDLALSTAVFQVLDTRDQSIALDGVWRQSVAAGCVARAIAKHIGLNKVATGEAAQGAMLHEVGRIALATRLREKYADVVRLIEGGEGEIEAERRALGCGHPEVGGYLLGLWGMPDAVVEAVTFHHEPEEAREVRPGVVAAAFAAITLVRAYDGNLGPEQVATTLARVNLAEQTDSLWEIATETMCNEEAKT